MTFQVPVISPQEWILSNLLSLVLGSITYRFIIAFVMKLGMPANDLKLFTAITVAVALALPTIRKYIHPVKITIVEEGE